MTFAASSVAIVVAAAVLAGCCTPPPDRVILLPGEGGRPTGGVTVRAAKGEVSLDEPYALARVSATGEAAPGKTTAEAVQKEFGSVLALRPVRAQYWTVYFEPGGNTLTPQSEAMLPMIHAELSRVEAGEIVVTGHTDRVGSLDANDALSIKRASAVRDLLAAAGVDPARISVAGRGEREPVVPTADEVAEPRNRRVEIKIR